MDNARVRHGEQAYKAVASDREEPINLGSSESVTINQHVDIVDEIAGVRLEDRYDVSAPKGGNGQNSENTRIRELLEWKPNIPLAVGLRRAYAWIYDQYVAKYGRGLLRVAA
jgi:GDP-D-mannose 3',5'-epimerase